MGDLTPVEDFKGLASNVTDVREAEEVWRGAESVISGEWLGIEDVDRGAGNDAFGQRVDQRILVDNRPARGVGDVRSRLHHLERLGVDQPAAPLTQPQMDGDVVRLLENLLFGAVAHALLGAPLFGQVRAPGDHVHSVDLAETGDLGAEPAETCG